MTELPRESLPLVPFDRPELIEQQVSRLAFMAELLQPDGYGETGAVLLPADHDGDEKPETLELVLTEREMWRLYRDEALMPNREAFLEETPSGQVISRHMTVVNHLGRWANDMRQTEHLVSLDVQPEPDSQSVADWAMENLGIDIESVYQASAFTEVDDEAYELVALATAEIEGAYRGLQTTTLILMAVPELQIGNKDQGLRLGDDPEDTWHVNTITGNGNLVLTKMSDTYPYARRRVASVEEVLEWNDKNFVPDQASGVRTVS